MAESTQAGTGTLQPSPRNRITLSLDPRLIIALLLLVIIGMLAAWRPWSTTTPTGADARTVKVTGEATIKAEPDEFVFYPTYTLKAADRDKALQAMTAKSDDVIAGLKKLGITDKQIKTNADSYDRDYYKPMGPDSTEPSYTVQLTITAGSRDLAQKVQDYLSGTQPTGTISPSANFSTAKRKELESKARDEATKDARAKADQSARNLGFEVGKVKTVSDGSGFGDPMPLMGRGSATMDAAMPEKRLAVQPGENELSYSVTVEYFVK